MAMLEVKDLNTGYGKVTVVNDISFDVAAGEWVSIVGNNGAGKTTLLKAILGLLPVSSGSISFEGKDITKAAPNQRIRKGMAFVPQGQQSFGTMTVDETCTWSPTATVQRPRPVTTKPWKCSRS